MAKSRLRLAREKLARLPTPCQERTHGDKCPMCASAASLLAEIDAGEGRKARQKRREEGVAPPDPSVFLPKGAKCPKRGAPSKLSKRTGRLRHWYGTDPDKLAPEIGPNAAKARHDYTREALRDVLKDEAARERKLWKARKLDRAWHVLLLELGRYGVPADWKSFQYAEVPSILPNKDYFVLLELFPLLGELLWQIQECEFMDEAVRCLERWVHNRMWTAPMGDVETLKPQYAHFLKG